MPPMLHVAFDELTRGRAHQLRAPQVRRREAERHHVLDLVAEAERAPGLIVAAARPQPGRHGLILQPAVHQHVERVVGSLHLDGPERALPERRDGRPCALRRRRVVVAREQLGGVGVIASLSEDERHGATLARRHLDVDGERAARVEAGAETVGQRHAVERGGSARAAVASEHLDTVAGRRRCVRSRGEERGAAREVLAVGIGREHAGVRGFPCGHHVRGDVAPRRAEAPLDVGIGAEPAGPGAAIGDREHGELHGIVDRDEARELVREIAALVLVARHAGSVPDDPARIPGRTRHRARRRAPARAALLVAQIEAFGAEVGHGIVGERREPILAAVLRPAERRAALGDEAPEARIGEDVAPRSGRVGLALERDHVLGAFGREAADAVAEQDGRWLEVRGLRRRRTLARRRPTPERGPARLRIGPIELVRELATLAVEHRARDREQEHAVGGGERLAPQQVHAGGFVAPSGPRAAAEEAGDAIVHLAAVPLGVLVQDHEVGGEAFHAPVFLGLQRLLHERQILALDDQHHDDRQITRNAELPESRLPAHVLSPHRCAGSEGRVDPEDA